MRYVTLIDGMNNATSADLQMWTNVLLSGEGVVIRGTDPLKVSQTASPEMKVLVQPGTCFVLRDAYVESDNTQKFWNVVVTASEQVNIDSNSSGLTRIDAICVKIDTAATPDDDASNVATLVAVKGTAGAGNPTIPDNHLLLAYVSVEDGETTILNADITDSRSEIGSSNGWTNANESWAYASATTITVPAGATSRYVNGDRIKLTQTTVKYFHVIGVADTVLTVTGGSDYTVANAAITLNYYSHQANPVGFPKGFSYTPTWTGSTNPSLGNGTLVGRFSLNGSVVSVEIHLRCGATTTYGTGAYFITLPIIASSSLSDYGIIGTALAFDASASYLPYVGTFGFTTNRSSLRFFFHNTSGSMSPTNPFTLTTSDELLITANYEIAT